MVDDWLHMNSHTWIDSEVAVGTWAYLEQWSGICGTLNMYRPYPYSAPSQMRPAYPTPGATSTTLCNGPVYYDNDGVSLDEIPMPALSKTANAGNSLVKTDPANPLSGLGTLLQTSDICFADPCSLASNHIVDTAKRCAFDVAGGDSTATGAGSNYDYNPTTRELVLHGGSGSSTKCAPRLELSPGAQYRFCKLTIQGGARLVIPDSGATQNGGQTDTPTRIWIEDNQQPPFPGESKCTNTSSTRLSISAAGKIQNETGDPSTLLIIGKGQKMRNSGVPDSSYYHMCFCSKYYDSGGATTQPEAMMIWAPHYQVDIQRTTNIDGAVAAGRLYLKSKARIDWNDNVAELGLDQLKVGLNYSPQQGTWKECGKSASFASTVSPDSTC
jgi:hypothetical protein